VAGDARELDVLGVKLELRIALVVECRLSKFSTVEVAAGAVCYILPGKLPGMRIDMARGTRGGRDSKRSAMLIWAGEGLVALHALCGGVGADELIARPRGMLLRRPGDLPERGCIVAAGASDPIVHHRGLVGTVEFPSMNVGVARAARGGGCDKLDHAV
jgi:hypothetical protein